MQENKTTNTTVQPDDKKLWDMLSEERKSLQEQGVLPHWVITQGWQMLKKSYLVEGENCLKGRFETIAKTLSKHLGKHAAEYEKKFFDLMWQGILSPSTPVLANCGTERGMVVSCSGQVVGDSVDSFYTSLHETAILSKYGFGTAADFSSIRPRGSKFSDKGKANGVSDVIDDFFTAAGKISQGGTRRGSFGAYLDIEHLDFEECIDKLHMDSSGRNYGWVVRDSFVEKLKAGDKVALDKFQKVLHTKLITGKGYLFFVDKANRHRPQMYKDKGLEVVASQLCSEIVLHSSEELTYSCVLSSLNLLHWDKIKNSDAAFTATVFLDCLCSEFIEQSAGIRGLEKVRKFTELGRAVGLSVMGWHTYLQYSRIPYASLEAQFERVQVAQHLQEESLRASKWLAQEFGEPEWCKGYGVRNTHRTAYAPTKSTSLIQGGVSESWFPDAGMVFEAVSAAGEMTRIPPAFYELMKEKGVYNQETVNDIIAHLGSVQHVDWLTPEDKQVFLNAFETDQKALFRQAMLVQRHTCQGQSMNFYIPEDSSEDLIAELMTEVFLHPDCLSQYYIYSRSGVVVQEGCISCAA